MSEAAKPDDPHSTAGRQLKRLATAFALALVAGLLALLVYRLATQENARGFVNKIAAGEKPAAPEFALKPLGGGPGRVSLASFRGKAVVVNFWASWCGPCKQEAGLLQQAHERWRSRGVVFLGVDGQDLTSDALAFLSKHGVTYRNLDDHRNSLVGHWGVTGFPETFFVDREGRAVGHVARQVKSAGELDAQIEKALE